MAERYVDGNDIGKEDLSTFNSKLKDTPHALEMHLAKS